MLAVSILPRVLANSCKLAVAANLQQVRFVRKTKHYDTKYGIPPIFNNEEYDRIKENGLLEEYSFKQVRFAEMWDNSSPLHDEDWQQFADLCMKKSRKWLAHELMRDTFYHIKCIQLKKANRLKKRQLEAEEKGQQLEQDPENPESTYVETDPFVIFKKALENCQPMLVVTKVKRGGAIYQVPYPITEKQSKWLAARWMRETVLERPKPRRKLFPESLASELIDAFLNRGKTIKKRDDIHRLADANKAYAHYRWG